MSALTRRDELNIIEVVYMSLNKENWRKMELKNIQEKVLNGSYKNIRQFATDVRALFDNVIANNTKTSRISIIIILFIYFLVFFFFYIIF